MHKFLYDPKAHDYWADEGIPSFMEKAYGYLYKETPDAPQNLHLEIGFPDSSSQFWLWLTHHALKLSQIVSSARLGDPSNEDAQRMVALFLYKNDKLKQFLDLTFKAERGKYRYFIEAAFNKPLSELDPLFDAYIADLNKNHDAINKLPESEIFGSKEEYDRFIKEHDLAATLHL
jgi:hypothetical protein